MKSIATVLLFTLAASYAGFEGENQFGAGRTRSVSWGDANNDGYPDMAIVNSQKQQNYLYINNGDGSFTEIEEFGKGTSMCAAWGDYDNDGDMDVAVANYQEQCYLYVNNGDGSFTPEAQFGSMNTMSIAWGDYDLDGDLDLAVGNAGESNYVYENNSGTFSIGSTFGIGFTYSIAWGDFDNDGDLDMAVGNCFGDQNYLYLNNGSGSFSEEMHFGASWTSAVAWGDYDNDADLDIAVSNIYGSSRLYQNQGTGFFSEVFSSATGDAFSVAWGDYDNDGDIDLMEGKFPGQNYLYVNEGSGNFSQLDEFGARNTYSFAWGDYDLDGDLDGAVGNFEQNNELFVNDDNGSDFLSVHLVGRFHIEGGGYSNRDGIGAKVMVFEDGYLGNIDHLLGFREIEANSGYCGQDSKDAEFGLPDDDYVDILVIWPGSAGSHIEDECRHIAKGQFLTILEGEGISGIEFGDNPAPLIRFELYPTCPNPANGPAAISFYLPEAANTQLSVFDIYGREVAIIVDEDLTIGNHERYISGLSAGVYLCRLTANDFCTTVKMVVR